jgi:hypothetical protein
MLLSQLPQACARISMSAREIAQPDNAAGTTALTQVMSTARQRLLIDVRDVPLQRATCTSERRFGENARI